jgi:hypothetical protein
MQGKRMTLRWFRVATLIAAVPVFFIAIGAPVVAVVWMGLVILASSLLMAVRLGWGAESRSIAEILHALDAETVPRPVPVTSPATPRFPRVDNRRDR